MGRARNDGVDGRGLEQHNNKLCAFTVTFCSATMPPKGKKGRRGDDSDDEPVVKAKPVEEEPAKGKGKKDKKEQPKKKGGKRGGDSDDDVDPLAAMKKLAVDSDDEIASVPSSKAETNVSNASKKNAKKDKKKGGKKVNSVCL